MDVFDLKNSFFHWQNQKLQIVPNNKNITELDKDKIDNILLNYIRKSNPLLAEEQSIITVILYQLPNIFNANEYKVKLEIPKERQTKYNNVNESKMKDNYDKVND